MQEVTKDFSLFQDLVHKVVVIYPSLRIKVLDLKAKYLISMDFYQKIIKYW